ncbi:hypothetical protein [Flavobacterium sp. ZS1P14]
MILSDNKNTSVPASLTTLKKGALAFNPSDDFELIALTNPKFIN